MKYKAKIKIKSKHFFYKPETATVSAPVHQTTEPNNFSDFVLNPMIVLALLIARA